MLELNFLIMLARMQSVEIGRAITVYQHSSPSITNKFERFRSGLDDERKAVTPVVPRIDPRSSGWQKPKRARRPAARPMRPLVKVKNRKHPVPDQCWEPPPLRSIVGRWFGNDAPRGHPFRDRLPLPLQVRWPARIET